MGLYMQDYVNLLYQTPFNLLFLGDYGSASEDLFQGGKNIEEIRV
jgi:hypothetical protein